MSGARAKQRQWRQHQWGQAICVSLSVAANGQPSKAKRSLVCWKTYCLSRQAAGERERKRGQFNKANGGVGCSELVGEIQTDRRAHTHWHQH